MYAEPHHPFVEICIKDLYKNGNRKFINDDGTDNAFVIDLFMMLKLKELYGIKYREQKQILPDGITIYDSTVFATKISKTKDSVLIHWFDQSWVNDKSLKTFAKRFIKKYLYFLYRRFV
jgi:hypothetical protein